MFGPSLAFLIENGVHLQETTMGGDSSATPAQMAIWEAEELTPPESFGEKFNAVKNYFGRGWKAVVFGSYSYSYLCMPTIFPWKQGGNAVRYYPLSCRWKRSAAVQFHAHPDHFLWTVHPSDFTGTFSMRS
jgi:hypothetical protein